MRIALLSTPRCGTTWLRYLLGWIYAVPEFGINDPAGVEWENLPEDLVYSFHWHPTPAFLTSLERYGFQVVVLARHPLDVLISLLHYALHFSTVTTEWLDALVMQSASARRWLAFKTSEKDETSIYGATPCSAAFLDYATSPRVAALLSVSWEWWKQPNCHQVRYEDLVANPHDILIRLVQAIGRETKKPISEAIAGHTIPKLRRQHTQVEHHFWQGKPGLWRQFLPPAEAGRIAAAHPIIFSDLGYPCDPDSQLTPSQADANWMKLTWRDLAAELKNSQRLKKELREAQEQLAASRIANQNLETQLTQAREHIAQSPALGPLALKIAKGIRTTSMRFPKTASLVKRAFS
jgi:hypothetical protein